MMILFVENDDSSLKNGNFGATSHPSSSESSSTEDSASDESSSDSGEDLQYI